MNRITLDIGTRLLSLTDYLIDKRDLKALDELHHIITPLILANVTDDKISLIEINEYIGEAQDLFSEGRSPEVIKQSSIRKLIAS